MVIDRQTWSLSDMVFAVPVLAAALANTLSGTGVNLKVKNCMVHVCQE